MNMKKILAAGIRTVPATLVEEGNSKIPDLLQNLHSNEELIASSYGLQSYLLKKDQLRHSDWGPINDIGDQKSIITQLLAGGFIKQSRKNDIVTGGLVVAKAMYRNHPVRIWEFEAKKIVTQDDKKTEAFESLTVIDGFDSFVEKLNERATCQCHLRPGMTIFPVTGKLVSSEVVAEVLGSVSPNITKLSPPQIKMMKGYGKGKLGVVRFFELHEDKKTVLPIIDRCLEKIDIQKRRHQKKEAEGNKKKNKYETVMKNLIELKDKLEGGKEKSIEELKKLEFSKNEKTIVSGFKITGSINFLTRYNLEELRGFLSLDGGPYREKEIHDKIAQESDLRNISIPLDARRVISMTEIPQTDGFLFLADKDPKLSLMLAQDLEKETLKQVMGSCMVPIFVTPNDVSVPIRKNGRLTMSGKSTFCLNKKETIRQASSKKKNHNGFFGDITEKVLTSIFSDSSKEAAAAAASSSSSSSSDRINQIVSQVFPTEFLNIRIDDNRVDGCDGGGGGGAESVTVCDQLVRVFDCHLQIKDNLDFKLLYRIKNVLNKPITMGEKPVLPKIGKDQTDLLRSFCPDIFTGEFTIDNISRIMVEVNKCKNSKKLSKIIGSEVCDIVNKNRGQIPQRPFENLDSGKFDSIRNLLEDNGTHISDDKDQEMSTTEAKEIKSILKVLESPLFCLVTIKDPFYADYIRENCYVVCMTQTEFSEYLRKCHYAPNYFSYGVEEAVEEAGQDAGQAVGEARDEEVDQTVGKN